MTTSPIPTLSKRVKPSRISKPQPMSSAASSTDETPSNEQPYFTTPIHEVNPMEDAYVEDVIRAKAIGARIRKLRLKRSMGLVELGRKTGMSASFLSQLETGRVVPTLRNLSRIALVFGRDLTFFFAEKNENSFRKLRGADRIRLPIGDKSSPYLISESMSALIPDRSLIPCIAEFLPNERNAKFEPSIFRGQEFIYVIDGSITLSMNHECRILESQDVAWIDGTTRRQYSCNENKPAKAMIVTCPR